MPEFGAIIHLPRAVPEESKTLLGLGHTSTEGRAAGGSTRLRQDVVRESDRRRGWRPFLPDGR